MYIRTNHAPITVQPPQTQRCEPSSVRGKWRLVDFLGTELGSHLYLVDMFNPRSLNRFRKTL